MNVEQFYTKKNQLVISYFFSWFWCYWELSWHIWDVLSWCVWVMSKFHKEETLIMYMLFHMGIYWSTFICQFQPTLKGLTSWSSYLKIVWSRSMNQRLQTSLCLFLLIGKLGFLIYRPTIYRPGHVLIMY